VLETEAIGGLERVDGFDTKGHLIRTVRVVVKNCTRRQVESRRARALASVGSVPGVVRARILPWRGSPIDIGQKDLESYVEGEHHVR